MSRSDGWNMKRTEILSCKGCLKFRILILMVAMKNDVYSKEKNPYES